MLRNVLIGIHIRRCVSYAVTLTVSPNACVQRSVVGSTLVPLRSLTYVKIADTTTTDDQSVSNHVHVHLRMYEPGYTFGAEVTQRETRFSSDW